MTEPTTYRRMSSPRLQDLGVASERAEIDRRQSIKPNADVPADGRSNLLPLGVQNEAHAPANRNGRCRDALGISGRNDGRIPRDARETVVRSQRRIRVDRNIERNASASGDITAVFAIRTVRHADFGCSLGNKGDACAHAGGQCFTRLHCEFRYDRNTKCFAGGLGDTLNVDLIGPAYRTHAVKTRIALRVA